MKAWGLPQAQQITDTGMVITPAEFGAQVVLSDMMMLTVRDEFMSVASRILADSFDRQQDQTLCDDFDSFSKALGSAGTAPTIGHAMASEASIKYNAPANGTAGRGGEAGPGQVHWVLTPAQAHSVKKGLSGQTGGAVVQASGGTANQPGGPPDPQGFSETFNVGTVMCHTDININKDASDDAKGGALVPGALILVELGPSAGIASERDESLRATEVNFVGRWARGEYDDDWGGREFGPSKTASDQWGTPEMATLSKQAYAVQLQRLSEVARESVMRQSDLHGTEHAEVGGNDQPRVSDVSNKNARDALRFGSTD